jgi:hypothetical protein
MQLFIFLALLPLHVSAPCSHAASHRWTHLILINVNLVQQDATIQDTVTYGCTYKNILQRTEANVLSISLHDCET